MMPPDWQARMIEMIRGAEPPELRWFTGGPSLGATEQIGVYQEQYQLRIGDAVREEVPGLLPLLGADADRVISAYIAACPSESWTLNRVHHRLPAFLRSQGRPQVEVEMAELERAVSESFEAEDHPPLPPALLTTPGALARLKLGPAVRLLRFRAPVHRLRSALLLDEPLPPLEDGDYPLALCRPERQVRHLELHPAAWGLLRDLGAGHSLGDALSRASSEADPTWLAGQLSPWFQLFVERRVLVAG